MSTKIYNGFRMAETDFVKIHELLLDWRKELRTLQSEATAKFLAIRSVKMIDEAVCGLLKEKPKRRSNPLSEAWSEFHDRQNEIKKTGRRDPAVDHDFSVSLFPFEGRVYGIVFTEQRKWEELWFAKPGIERFGYWNDSDREDCVSEEEWNERKRIWDSIMARGYASIPSMAGFSADCTVSGWPVDKEDVARHVPAFEWRVGEMAELIVCNERMNAVRKGQAEDESQFSSRIMDAYIAARRWLKSEDGQSRLEAEKTRLRTVLKPEIGVDDLIAEFPEDSSDHARSPKV